MNIIKIGDRCTVKRIFTADDVELFAKVTGDYNPIHFDEKYAKTTIFKKPIVHGPLVITLITTIFAKELPGPGTVYLSHEVKYFNPVYLGEEIIGTVEVVSINDKQHIFVKTTCVNASGLIILEGIARLKKY